MVKLYLYRFVSTFFVAAIMILKKFREDDRKNSGLSVKFIEFNNNFVFSGIKNKKIKPEQILILLPHCLQESDCAIKITTDINKCIMCGKCDISGLTKLASKYKINIKVATGGTLARKYVKELKPKVVIAVACERDIVTGVYDSFPMPVIGLFNDRINGPCFNTKTDVNEIENIIKKITA